MKETKDISIMSVTELKALKCDFYESISQNQHNLQIINVELQKREEVPKKTK